MLDVVAAAVANLCRDKPPYLTVEPFLDPVFAVLPTIKDNPSARVACTNLLRALVGMSDTKEGAFKVDRTKVIAIVKDIVVWNANNLHGNANLLTAAVNVLANLSAVTTRPLEADYAECAARLLRRPGTYHFGAYFVADMLYRR